MKLSYFYRLPLNMLYDLFLHSNYFNPFLEKSPDNALSVYFYQNRNTINNNLWLLSGHNIDVIASYRNIKDIFSYIENDLFISLLNRVYSEYYKNEWRNKSALLRKRQYAVTRLLNKEELSQILLRCFNSDISNLNIFPIVSFTSSGLISNQLNILLGNKNSRCAIQTLLHEIGHLILIRNFNTSRYINNNSIELAANLIQQKISRELGYPVNRSTMKKYSIVYSNWRINTAKLMEKPNLVIDIERILNNI